MYVKRLAHHLPSDSDAGYTRKGLTTGRHGLTHRLNGNMWFQGCMQSAGGQELRHGNDMTFQTLSHVPLPCV